MMGILTSWGALALGLMAWILPVIALVGRKCGGWVYFSMAFCTLSLLLVIVHLSWVTDIGDWSALMDTAGAFRLCAVVLVVVTLALNAVVLLAHRRRRTA